MTNTSLRPYKFSHYGRWLIGASCVAVQGAAHAQTADIQDEPVILNPVQVNASRLPPSEAPDSADVNVLDRNDIDRLQTPNTLSILQAVPGLDVTRRSRVGGGGFVSIRGGDENFVQVIIDGVKVNDPTGTAGGAFDFSLLDPALIDQVVVVKRPLSPLYGSDGLSGGVFVDTRRAGDEAPQTGRISIDSLGRAAIGASLGADVGDGGITIGAGWRDDGEQKGGEGFERGTVFARFDQSITPRHDLAATLLYADAERAAFPDTSGGFRLAEDRTLETLDTTQLIAIAKLDSRMTDQLRLVNTISLGQSEAEGVSPGILAMGNAVSPPSTSQTDFERIELSSYGVWAGKLSADVDLDVSAGGAWLSEDGQQDATFDLGIIIPDTFTLKRETLSGFAEGRIVLDEALEARIGARHDDLRGGDSSTTYSASALWRPDWQGPNIELAWAEGFKQPSFFALGSALVGNPDLLPEESEAVSLSFIQALGQGAQLNVAVFDNRYTNLIEFAPDLFTNINLGRVDVRGIDAELAARLTDQLEVTGGLTLQETEVDGSQSDLRFRPDLKGRVMAVWAMDDATEFVGAIFHTGDRLDSAFPVGDVSLEAYTLLSVQVRRQVSDAVSVAVVAENLTNTAYETSIGSEGEGAVLRVNLSAGF